MISVQNLRAGDSPARKEGDLAHPGNFAQQASPVRDAQVATICANLVSPGAHDNSILDELSKLEVVAFDDQETLLIPEEDSDEDSV